MPHEILDKSVELCMKATDKVAEDDIELHQMKQIMETKTAINFE